MKKFFNLFVICVTGFSLVSAVPAFNSIDHDNEIEPQESTWTRISREYGKCMSTSDAMNCMAVKTVTALQRAVRLPAIEVLPGVQLVRNSPYGVRDGKALSENEIEQSLPKTFSEKTAKLVDLLLESTANFLTTHSIQIKLPEETTRDLGRALEEGRKKKKKMKMMGGLMMLMGAKVMMLLPLLLIGTKFLAIKALLIAKIALLLALVGSAGSLGSLFSGKGGSSGGGNSGGSSGWSSSYAPSGSSGWSSGGGGGPYARRSMSDDVPQLPSSVSSASSPQQLVDAHDLAYSAQKSL